MKESENEKLETEVLDEKVEENPSEMEIVEKEAKKTVEVVKGKKIRSRKFLILSGILGFIGLVILIYLLVSVYKVDASIWPSKLSGIVNDEMNNPISGVAVCIQNHCVDTDNSGIFTIGGLIYGQYDYTAIKSGYNGAHDTVNLNRGAEEKLTLQLEKIIVGNIVIPVKFEYNAGHQYYNDAFSFKIDDGNNDYIGASTECLDTRFNIYVTCTVSFNNLPIGKHTMEIVSTYYYGTISDFEVTLGTTNLPQVLLSPIVEISGSVSDGFFGGPLEKAKIKFTAPFQLELETDATGNYSVKNIKIPQSTYPKLKVVYEISKDGYVTLTSESELSVDYNYPIYDTLLPQGKVVTVSNKIGNKNLISTGIDGSNAFTISDNKGDNYNPVLLSDGKTIRFLSTRDGTKSMYGTIIPMVYQIDIDGKNLKKISKTIYFDNDGIGSFNLVSSKRAYSIYETRPDMSGYYSLKVGNIDGTELKTVETNKVDGYYGEIVIADSGEFMLYTWKDNADQTKNGVYMYNFVTDKIDFLYNIKDSNYFEVKTISQDLNKALILISSNWDDEGDLWLLNIADKKLTRVTNSTTGEQNPTFYNDDKSILYLSRRDNLLNVYLWDLAKGTETKVNNVSGTDQEFYANMCADLVASTKYEPTRKLIDKALGQENAMCPGPYFRYYSD